MKKLVAALTTAFVAVALVVVGAAAPVSAHTPTLTGSAVCDASTGTWTVSYTFVETNVPNHAQSSTKVTAYSPTASTLSSSSGVGTGTGVVLSTFSSAPLAGVQTRTGNWSASLTQTGIDASQTQSSVTIHTDWSDRYSADASYTVHFTGTCGTTPPVTPTDASASVTTGAPTCTTGESLVLGKASNAAWGKPSYSGSTYSVVATANSDHEFAPGTGVSADGSTDTFTGTLADKLSPTNPKCVTTPVCIPASAVTYTYSPQTNGGVITVADVANSTGQLCEGFYVTATSWLYEQSNNVWPQKLDVVNKYYIDAVGTYAYGAPVACGQGDIYAATSAAGQPNPPQELLGANNPWPEHFLHDMGFKGDSPTYTQADITKCFTTAPLTGTPTTTVATCAAPTANSASLPAVDGGIWTISENGTSKAFPVGAGTTTGVIAGYYGDYTLTLTDASSTDHFDVTGTTTTWTPIDISKVDCNNIATPVSPKVTFITTCGTSGSIVTTDTADVHYALTSGNGTSGANVVTATAQPGFEFGRDANNKAITTYVFPTIQLGTPAQCIDIVPGTPSVVDQTCVAGVDKGGSITVENQDGLIWEITSADKTVDVKNAVGTTSNLFPGIYTVTATVDNSTNPNFVLAGGGTSKSFTVEIKAAVDCRTIVVSASIIDAQCTPTPNGATPQTYAPGTVTITPDVDLTWNITDNATNTVTALTETTTPLNAGSYTVTAVLSPAAQALGAFLPVSTWPVTISTVDCTVATGEVDPPDASVCAKPHVTVPDLTSWIHQPVSAHVTYAAYATTTIDGVTTTSTTGLPLVDGYNSIPAGTYTVVATADSGYTLDTSGLTTQSWDITVEDQSFCPKTEAAWHAGASTDPAVCVSTTAQEGDINLVHLRDETGKVTYTITNQKTGKVFNAGATATKVKVAPGEYTVRAKATTAGDGISTASVFRNLVVKASTTACSNFTPPPGGGGGSLAFTGQSASFGILGFLLAAGLLFLGFAGVVVRRARRNAAE